MRAVVDTVEAPATAPQQQRSTAAPPPGPVTRFTGVAELLTVTLLWGKRRCVVAWPQLLMPMSRPSSFSWETALGLICGPYVCAAGSYNPTLKMIYSEEHPLDPATLTAIRTVLSALALLVAVAAKPQQQPQQQQQQQRSTNPAAPDEDADTTSPLHRSQGHSQPSGSQAPGQINAAATTAAVTAAAGKLSTAAKAAATTAMATATRFAPLSATFSTVLAAGLELGLYNFAGTSLQAVGVKLLSATRAGFLQQLIVVLTPLLAYLAVSTGGQVDPRPCPAECATADAAQAHVVAVVPMPQRSRLPFCPTRRVRTSRHACGAPLPLALWAVSPLPLTACPLAATCWAP